MCLFRLLEEAPDTEGAAEGHALSLYHSSAAAGASISSDPDWLLDGRDASAAACAYDCDKAGGAVQMGVGSLTHTG